MEAKEEENMDLRLKRVVLTATVVLLVSAMSLPAGIIGGSVTGGTSGGTFVELTTPLSNPFGPANSVGEDNFQSPDLYAFDEEQDVVLGSPLSVDLGVNPIPSGTTVSSHYIFFDPTDDTLLSVEGTVEFDAPIIAVITSTGFLLASDSILGVAGVGYLSPTLRGLEVTDSFFISGLNEITVNFLASSPGDYIRVITSNDVVIPEPASLTMVGGGLLALGVLLRRRGRSI
jgi:hypothetical protein